MKPSEWCLRRILFEVTGRNRIGVGGYIVSANAREFPIVDSSGEFVLSP
jgi:hypothetical protein